MSHPEAVPADANPVPLLEQPFPFSSGGITHPVYCYGRGPAVVIMHELPGMTPAFVQLATKTASSGFRVYAPLFFGKPNHTSGLVGIASNIFCIRREFNLFTSNAHSPIADWLRALCRRADSECGNRGVGLIGLCLTGNVVLSVMLEPSVRVPVMCEPSLPIAFHQAALAVPQEDVEEARRVAVTKPILAYRFTTDTKCPKERFDTLRSTFGSNVHTTEIPTGVPPFDIPDRSHSVLTGNYPNQDRPDHPVQLAFDEILARFRAELASKPATA